MSDIVIKAENLGKKYTIGHQAENGRYVALRDVLMQNARSVWHKTKDLVQGKPIILGDTLEEVWALRDVSFEIQRGEVVGIIGRNGAGKSTLLKVLSRITEPSAGRVTIKGRVASLLEVGTGFHPELTGRENIYLNGAILGMTRQEIKRKYDEIVAFAEIEKFLDTPVKRYSSGMYVRLAFAVAAHLEPEILVVDEVLAVGDYEFQKKCLGKMGEIGREGRTVLLVSHNLQTITNFCERGVLLDKGKVVTDGRAMEVIQHYLTIGRYSDSVAVWSDPAIAPGNDKVRLHSVQILSQEGQPASELDIAKEIIIQIRYWCLKKGVCPSPAFWLSSHMGIAVLESHNATGVSLTPDEWYDRPHRIGLYESKCRVPANLLNDGTYYVTPGIMGIRESTVVDAVSFHVYDSGEMPKNNPWMGVVRPRLSWSTEHVGDDLAFDAAIVRADSTNEEGCS